MGVQKRRDASMRPVQSIPAWALTALLILSHVLPCSAQEAEAEGVVEGSSLTVLDRIVAVIDEDPIFLSDIRLAIALERFRSRPEDTGREKERWVLERLIEERLRQHEVDRHQLGPLDPELVEGQVAELRSRFADPEAMALALGRQGLDEEGLRHQIQRQLRVLRYVEERLSPRIFVDLSDIEVFYNQELTPQLAAEDIPLPPLEEVREEIRGLLRERRLNGEIERWTEELRAAADIEELYDRPPRELPPVVRRLGG